MCYKFKLLTLYLTIIKILVFISDQVIDTGHNKAFDTIGQAMTTRFINLREPIRQSKKRESDTCNYSTDIFLLIYTKMAKIHVKEDWGKEADENPFPSGRMMTVDGG